MQTAIPVPDVRRAKRKGFDFVVCPAGQSPPSFDKQFVRDYLETLDWDKTPPGPSLPGDILEKTFPKYVDAFERLRGASRPDLVGRYQAKSREPRRTSSDT